MFNFENKSDAQISDFLVKNQGRLETKRRPYEPLWDVETKIFQPRRYDLLRTEQPGQQYGALIYDGHPQNAANKFTQGIIGYMMSNATPWLSFSTANTSLMDLDEIKQYFQEASEQILSSFNRSTFYDESPQFTKDGAVTGSPVMLPEEDLVDGSVVYQTFHPGDVYIEDNGRGLISVLHIKRTLTAATMLEMFDKKTLPAELILNIEGDSPNYFREYKCIYAMYKNTASSGESLKSTDKAYKTFWILREKQGDKQLLEQSGVDWGPVDWRPGREPGRAYGTSIAADALTEALITNQLGKKEIQAVHGAVEPAMRIHKNLRGNVQLQPGGRTYFDKQHELMEAINENPNWPLSDAQMDRIHASIDDKFNTRLFETLTRGDLPGNITAFQISRMMGEKAVMLGSTILSFQKFLGKAIDVQWEFETAAGRMPEPPDILREETDGRVDIVFLGPLAQLQRSLLQSKGIIDGIAIAGEILAINPDSSIIVDWDDTLEDAMVAQGFPQDKFLSDDQVAAIKQAEAEVVAQQQQLEQGETIAKALPSAGKSIEPNSPLSLLGVGGAE